MLGRKLLSVVGLALFLHLLGLPGAGRADEEASRKIYPQTLRGTVWISWRSGDWESYGSGWLADRERKLVVTNHHVVDGTDAVQVYFPAFENDLVIPDRTYYLEKVRPVRGRVPSTATPG